MEALRTGCVVLVFRYVGTADKGQRTTLGCLTIRANRPCCKWHGAWRASWARSASGSIHSLPDTFTLREWIPISVAALSSGRWASPYRSTRAPRRSCDCRELTYYRMTAAYLDKQPHLLEKWSQLNPLGRIGRPDELRGVITWLASDASTFCTGSK